MANMKHLLGLQSGTLGHSLMAQGWNGHGCGLESLPNPDEERQKTSTKVKWCC